MRGDGVAPLIQLHPARRGRARERLPSARGGLRRVFEDHVDPFRAAPDRHRNPLPRREPDQRLPEVLDGGGRPPGHLDDRVVVHHPGRRRDRVRSDPQHAQARAVGHLADHVDAERHARRLLQDGVVRLQVRLARDRAELRDDEPVGAVVAVGPLGLPRQAGGKRPARLPVHELVHGRLLVVPPAHVVSRLRLRAEVEEHAGLPEQPQEGNHRRGRVQRVAAAVDDEERLVAQVGHVHLAVDVRGRVGEHHRVAVQRQKRRPGGRRLHRVIEGAGRPVGDPEQVDAVLVDVPGPLQVVEDAGQVLDLAVLPPERLVPGSGRHHDGVVPGEPLLPAPPGPVLASRPRDAAVQVDDHRPARRRVVALRHAHDVGVLHAVAILAGPQQPPGRDAARVGAAGAQPAPERLHVRIDGQDGRGGRRDLVVGGGGPEGGDRLVERAAVRLAGARRPGAGKRKRRRQAEDGGGANGDRPAAAEAAASTARRRGRLVAHWRRRAAPAATSSSTARRRGRLVAQAGRECHPRFRAASAARRRGRPGVGPVREPAAPRTGAARPRAGGAGHC